MGLQNHPAGFVVKVVKSRHLPWGIIAVIACVMAIRWVLDERAEFMTFRECGFEKRTNSIFKESKSYLGGGHGFDLLYAEGEGDPLGLSGNYQIAVLCWNKTPLFAVYGETTGDTGRIEGINVYWKGVQITNVGVDLKRQEPDMLVVWPPYSNRCMIDDGFKGNFTRVTKGARGYVPPENLGSGPVQRVQRIEL